MTDLVKKRSVDIAGHRTSVSIEAPFWDALRDIAMRRKTSINTLIANVDGARNGNLSSAIRVYVLRELQKQVRG
ncbi:MAG: aryl-sulfate sulfotransferase [Rhodospirillaceae bacterium]|nr:aryl-sulfate sulfotransferase [Rhodospirillaceae bacterium]